MRRRTGFVTTLGACAAAVLLWACQDASRGTAPRTTPPERPSSDMSATGAVHSAFGHAIACSKRSEQHGHEVIGPEGGVVVMGASRLYVAPGALDAPVDISGTVPSDTVRMVQLHPTGLHFHVPAILVVDASGCGIPDGTDVDVEYVNDAGVPLESIEAYYSARFHAVVAPIQHFSGYILAW